MSSETLFTVEFVQKLAFLHCFAFFWSRNRAKIGKVDLTEKARRAVKTLTRRQQLISVGLRKNYGGGTKLHCDPNSR